MANVLLRLLVLTPMALVALTLFLACVAFEWLSDLQRVVGAAQRGRDKPHRNNSGTHGASLHSDLQPLAITLPAK
jgi:hypothetical protein